MSAEGLTGVLGLASDGFLRWPQPNTRPHDYVLDISEVLPTGTSPFEWASDPYDVTGLPDIAIQVSTNGDNIGEAEFAVHIEVSLDGQLWARIPDADFQPDLSTISLNLGDLMMFIHLFVETHFLRVVLSTLTSAPYDAIDFTALITAGEA